MIAIHQISHQQHEQQQMILPHRCSNIIVLSTIISIIHDDQSPYQPVKYINDILSVQRNIRIYWTKKEILWMASISVKPVLHKSLAYVAISIVHSDQL